MHRHFSNPPTATVPHTAAMSNGLIGLLRKVCAEIKKEKNGEGNKREDVEIEEERGAEWE